MDEHELNSIVKRAGGARFDPYKQQRKEAEKLRLANDVGLSPFRIEKASAKQTSKQTQQPLYGDFWRTGEVSVLFGESGVGKSLLATQIAEVIARGAQDSINGLPTVEKPRRVIYFDFERTREQFSRIYSCRPYPNPDLVEKYKFSGRFDIARLDTCSDIPDAFKGNADRYIRFWVCDEIADGTAKIIIIDNLANLSVGTTPEKTMRALRAAATVSGASLLVIANAKPKRRPSEIKLADLSGPRAVADIADTVFAIDRSTLHPDIRYVKDLKSRTAPLTADLPATLRSALFPDQPPTTDDRPQTTDSAVLSYRIDRTSSPVEDRSSKIQDQRPQPFLGLNYLGLALESKHLPIKEQKSKIKDRPARQLKPGSTTATANMLLSKEYWSYLEP